MALSKDAYTLDSFADDCEELLHRCTTPKRQVYLRDFTRIWHNMNFETKYSIKPTGEDRHVLLRHIQIAKQLMVSKKAEYEEAVAALLILYKLMTVKPFAKYAFVIFVPEDIPAIDRLEACARQRSRSDVLYMLSFILSKGPDQQLDSVKDRELRIGAHLQGPELSTFLEGRSIELKQHSRVMEGLDAQSDRDLSDYDDNIAKKMAASFEHLSIGLASPSDACIPSTSGLGENVYTLGRRPIPAEPVSMNPVVSIGLDHQYAARSAKGKRPANETENKVKSSKKPKTSFEAEPKHETMKDDSEMIDFSVPGPSSADMDDEALKDKEDASTISMAEALEIEARVVLKPKCKRIRFNIPYADNGH